MGSTIDHPWVSFTGAEFTSGTSNASAIVIQTDSARQIIDGFGGCFNELGWEALQSLTVENRQTVANNLFDMHSGCKFTICRMPIGANDYAVNWYSHNETANDYEMKNFSLDRCR